MSVAEERVRLNALAPNLTMFQYLKLMQLIEDGMAPFASLRKNLIKHVSRFVFVLSWAEKQERLYEGGKIRRLPWPPGSKIEDYAPKKTPAVAVAWAKDLLAEIESKVAPIELVWANVLSASPDASLEIFSDYLVYEAIGAGPDWTDDHEDYDLHSKIRKIRRETLYL